MRKPDQNTPLELGRSFYRWRAASAVAMACNTFKLDLEHHSFNTCICGFTKAEHRRDNGPDLARAARQNLKGISPDKTSGEAIAMVSPPAPARAMDTGQPLSSRGSPPGRRSPGCSLPARSPPRSPPPDMNHGDNKVTDLEVEHRRLQSHAAKLRGKREALQQLRDRMDELQQEVHGSGGRRNEVGHSEPHL